MTTALARQIESLDASTTDAAASGSRPASAEELTELAVALFEVLKSRVLSWQRSARGQAPAQWEGEARSLEQAYRRLLDSFRGVGSLVESIERAGHVVGGAERFREARRELTMLCQFTVDQLLDADRQIRAGQARPASEVRDAVRHRLHAEGSTGLTIISP